MSDWFIRPLYYLEHLEISRRSQLVASILRFAKIVYKDQDECLGQELLRVSKSELLMCLLYACQKQEWPSDLDEVVNDFVDCLFFPEAFG